MALRSLVSIWKVLSLHQKTSRALIILIMGLKPHLWNGLKSFIKPQMDI